MRHQLLILAIGCTMAVQAQKARVFETSAKDEGSIPTALIL